MNIFNKNVHPKNAYGVIVGIGKYKDKDIPTLKYAKEDAQAIYDILTDSKYGNFPKENVKLLLDEEATLAEIKSAMGTFLARNAGEDDMVCIYFAGHGSPEIDPTGKADDKLEKFIVPYDAKKDDLFGYGLSMDVIEEIFHRITSKRVVFFLDCCYSGEAGGRTFSRPSVRNIAISEKFIEQLSGEGRIIITASKPDELSLETDEHKHGIFTYYLAKGLKGKADLNGNGFVTVDELYNYVYKQVEEKARPLGGKQHPLRKGMIIGEIPLTVNRGRVEEIKQAERKKKNLKGLSDWYHDGKLGDELYELACRLVETKVEEMSEDDKKVLKSLNALLSDKISISTFLRDVEIIKEPKVEEERIKKEEERKKQIFELSSQAQKLFEEKRFAKAIEKWREVLELEPKNSEAFAGIKEAERILEEIEQKKRKRKIAELNKSAQQLYEAEKYIEAIDEWSKVLDFDPENQTAKEGIKRAEEKLKEKITRLSLQAQKLFEEGRYTEAIAKWQDVLKLEPENSEAITGIEVVKRILKKIDELNTSAQLFYDEGKYHEAIGKWKEVLN